MQANEHVVRQVLVAVVVKADEQPYGGYRALTRNYGESHRVPPVGTSAGVGGGLLERTVVHPWDVKRKTRIS